MEPAPAHLVVLEDGVRIKQLITTGDAGGRFLCRTVRNRDELLTGLQQGDVAALVARSDGAGLDGISALELCRSLFPSVPVLIAFPDENPPAIIDALKRGATDYFIESDATTLLPALERALDEREHRRVQRLATDMLNHQQRALSLVASGMPVTDVLDLLLFILRRHLDRVAFAVHRVDQAGRRLRLLAQTGLPPEQNAALESLDLDRALGCLGRAVSDERPCSVRAAAAGDWSGVPGGYPASFAEVQAIPFFAADESVIGLMTLFVPDEGELEPTALAIVANLLQIASIALENEIREERLRAAIAEAERANREKSRFIVNMSHEIRTPMNGIIGMGDLLAASQMEAEQYEILKVIRSSGDILLNLIDDIIDLSRIESGRMQLEREPFRLRESVANIVRLLAPRAAANATELTADFAPDAPEIVVTDELRLQQILTNLISNSIKFTAGGAIRVQVRRSGDADEGRVRLEFTVTDTGTGIPPDRLDSIFAPFVQIEPRGEQRYRGAGLGLAISASLVQLMGGDIAVESEPGRGSVFRFDLPVRLARADESPRREVDADPEEAPGAIYPLSVLVVEDDLSNRIVVERLLTKIGYAPDLVESGGAALRLLAGRSYDLVLMDVQMPDMDGLETTRRIRAEHPNGARVIVALTANAMKEDMARCLEAGMNDYLSKPVSLEQISGMLRKWGRKLART